MMTAQRGRPAAASRFNTSTGPPNILRHSNGWLVVSWNNCEMPPRHEGQGVYGGRDALHIAVSDDEGQTWRGFREIYLDHRRNENPASSGDRGTAYPLGAFTADGKIVDLGRTRRRGPQSDSDRSASGSSKRKPAPISQMGWTSGRSTSITAQPKDGGERVRSDASWFRIPPIRPPAACTFAKPDRAAGRRRDVEFPQRLERVDHGASDGQRGLSGGGHQLERPHVRSSER